MPLLFPRRFAAVLATAPALAGLAGHTSMPPAPALTGAGVVPSIFDSQQADTTSGRVESFGGAISRLG